MLIKIYQVNAEKSEDARFALFSGTERLKRELKTDTTNPEWYKLVYVGDHPDIVTLEEVFFDFNDKRIPTLQGHSLSVSDVVEVLEDTDCVEKGFYFCDDIGWKNIKFDASKAEGMEGIKVIYVRPKCRPVVTHIWKELKFLQDAVSMRGEDSLIEFIYPFTGDMNHMILVGNEEAALIDMPFTFTDKDPAPLDEICTLNGGLQGPVFVTRDSDEDDGELASLTDEDIEKLEKVFDIVIK